MFKLKANTLNYLTLLGSASTLICCALPALLVSLSLGAVMAGLASNVPGLVWASENKIQIFTFAGLMLAVNGFVIWNNRNAPCPVDPGLRATCVNGRKTSQYLYLVSLAAYILGFTFAYILPLI